MKLPIPLEVGQYHFLVEVHRLAAPISVSGNIDFTGQLLQNGSPFVTLPTQDASNLGAVLRSGGTSEQAYWDNFQGEGTTEGASQARYKAGFNITRGFSCCGYRSSSHGETSIDLYIPHLHKVI